MIGGEDEDENQARFKIAKGFDFAQIVNWKLFEAMKASAPSSTRAAHVKDLEILLSFDGRTDKEYNDAIDAINKELSPNGGAITDYKNFSERGLRVMVALIKRKGYGGGTDADIDDDF